MAWVHVLQVLTVSGGPCNGRSSHTSPSCIAPMLSLATGTLNKLGLSASDKNAFAMMK